MILRSSRGAALILSLVLGIVLIFGVGALLATMVAEYRGTYRTSLNAVAFHLAEAGIDRVANAISAGTIKTTNGWTQTGSTYSRNYTVATNLAGRESKGYRVVYSSAVNGGTTTYTVSSRGWVRSDAGGILAQRAIETTFTLSNTGSGGMRPGAYARFGFTNGSFSPGGTISATQPGAVYDSYDSTNNAAPNAASNRSNQCVIGTLSSTDNALDLSNGTYYAQLKTGTSAGNPTPRVNYNVSSNGTILAQLDNPGTTAVTDLVRFDPNQASYVGRDFTASFTLPAPPSASQADTATWQMVVPATSAAQNSQCRLQASIGALQSANDLPNAPISFSGSTLTIGTSDTSKIYIPTRGLGNFTTLVVYGEVFIVTSGTINQLNVVFKTANAKLTLYTDSNVPVITSQQQLGTGNAVTNYEAKRLTVGILPGNAGLNSLAATNFTTANVSSAIATALANPTNGPDITLNNVGSKAITANFLAPWSAVQIDADGSQGGMFCGSLMARTLNIKGTNGFPFHCDQALSGGNGSTPTLTVGTWREILPTAAIFQ